MAHRIRWLLLLIVVAGAASLVTAWWTTRPPPSPLAAGLGGTQEQSSAELTRRLAARFPPGTRIDDIVWALAAEGFVRDSGGGARREEPGFPCSRIVHLEWQEYSGKVGGMSGWAERPCL